jgi:hypothetical protein
MDGQVRTFNEFKAIVSADVQENICDKRDLTIIN